MGEKEYVTKLESEWWKERKKTAKVMTVFGDSG